MNNPNWLTWRVSSFLFHTIISAGYMYCLVFDELTREERFKITSAKGEPSFAGDWKFLTRWNFLLQTIVFTISMLIDVLNMGRICLDNKVASIDTETSLKSNHPIQRLVELIDTIIISLGFPLGTFVTVVFWTLHALGPGNVGTGTPPLYPIMNHIVHTSVGIVVIIEILLTHHKKPPKDKSLIIIASFFTLFTCWLFFVHYKTGFWLYPIFAKLSPIGRALFLLGSLILFIALHFLGLLLHKKAWPEHRIIAFYGSYEAANEMNIDLVNYKNQGP